MPFSFYFCGQIGEFQHNPLLISFQHWITTTAHDFFYCQVNMLIQNYKIPPNKQLSFFKFYWQQYFTITKKRVWRKFSKSLLSTDLYVSRLDSPQKLYTWHMNTVCMCMYVIFFNMNILFNFEKSSQLKALPYYNYKIYNLT